MLTPGLVLLVIAVLLNIGGRARDDISPAQHVRTFGDYVLVVSGVCYFAAFILIAISVARALSPYLP